MKSHERGRLYAYLALAMAMVSLAYWTVYSLNAYNTFHEYTALDYYAYNMYYDVNYPSAMGGLQLLVFADHIVPDQLFILLAYYVFQSPLTLLLIQGLVLSATGLAVFFAARDLLRSGSLGLLMCFAFLLSPAMHGMLLFDYHAEILIVPLYVLTFYYYMKMRRGPYLVCLALLLGAMDVAPVLVVAMWLGLAAYELMHRGRGEVHLKRLRMGLWMLVGAVAALLAYNVVYHYLVIGYALPPTGLAGSGSPYSGVPPTFRVQPWPSVPLAGGHLAYTTSGISGGVSPLSQAIGSGAVAHYFPDTLNYYVVDGLVAGLLLFGIGGMVGIVPLLLFEAPWLIEVFVFGLWWFTSIDRQYFAYVLGGAFAAAVLGTMGMLERKSVAGRMLEARGGSAHARMVKSLAVASAAVIAAVVFLASLHLYVPGNITGFSHSVIMAEPTPVQPQSAYDQLNWVIARVPRNASLMTQDSIMPHVLGRRYLETPSMPLYFKPRYILIDPTANFSAPYLVGANQYAPFYEYMANSTYTLVAQNGSAMLYEEAGSPANGGG